jgi:pantothenate kinase
MVEPKIEKIEQLLNHMIHDTDVLCYKSKVRDIIEKKGNGRKHYEKMENRMQRLLNSSTEISSTDVDRCFLKALIAVMNANNEKKSELFKVISSFEDKKRRSLVELYKAEFKER